MLLRDMKQFTVKSLSLENCNGNVFSSTYSREHLLMDINVMYLDYLRKLKDKVPPFKVCNENKCKSIRHRFEEHQQKFHPNSLTKSFSKNKTVSHDHSVQAHSKEVNSDTETYYEDVTQDNRDHIDNIKNEVMKSGQIGGLIILKRTQSCNTAISFKNVYKDRLLYEVLQWLRGIPIESEFDTTAKIITEKAINNLIEKINKLSIEATSDGYDAKLRRVITKCLNSLPLTYHSTKCDKLKHMLTENLISRVMDLNSKYIYQFSSNTFRCNKFNSVFEANQQAPSDDDDFPLIRYFKNEITSWLESKRLIAKDGTTVNTTYVTMVLINRLLPFLMDKKINNGKYLVKSVIVEVLDALNLTYVTLDLNRDREYLNSLANELMKIVLNTKKNYVQSSKYNSSFGFSKTLMINLRNILHFSSKHKSAKKCSILGFTNGKVNSKYKRELIESITGSRETSIHFCHYERSQFVNIKSATLMDSLTSPDATTSDDQLASRVRCRFHARYITILSWESDLAFAGAN